RRGGASCAPRPRRRRSCPSCRTQRNHVRTCECCARQQWTRCSWSPPSLALFLSISGVRPDVQLTFVEHGEDTSDVATDSLETFVIVQLAGGRLEPQVEQLGLGLLELFGQKLVVETVQCVDGMVLRTDCHSHSPPSRATIRALSGSLWIARRRASRATSSDTPASSNMTR